MPNGANSQDLVQIKEIKDGTVVMEDGRLAQMVLVSGLNLALKSAGEQEAVLSAYQNFLNSIDFTIQIIVHSRKINIDKYLQSLDTRKEQEQSGLLQSQISEYQDFIRSFVQEYAVMRKMFVVVVPFVPIQLLPSKSSITSFIPFFGKKKPVVETESQSEIDAFKQATSQLRQRVNQVADGLRTVGLETKILEDDQIIELLYNFYNPETIEKQHITLPNSQQTSAGTNSTASDPRIN